VARFIEAHPFRSARGGGADVIAGVELIVIAFS
jgi:hypothetical protein